MTKIFAVYEHRRKTFLTLNGRCAWTKRGNAQRALDDAYLGKFDSDYMRICEVIELTAIFDIDKYISPNTVRLS